MSSFTSVLAACVAFGVVGGCAAAGVGAASRGSPEARDQGDEVLDNVASVGAAAPPFVDITWLSIANVYLEIGDLEVLINGYISRLPESTFYGGGSGYGYSRERHHPDVQGVERVLEALGGPDRVDLLLTGHSHWDHTFDTATWAELTGAPIIGSITTCLQAEAQGIAPARCLPVYGRERIELGDGVTMWVVRWNHSATSESAPEQHDPVELKAVPEIPAGETGLRPGTAEDFPNGGGNRAYLFRVDLPGGESYSWFFNDSAGASDLHLPIVVDGVDYGAPLDNLRAAMEDAELEAVDLWIGSGGRPIAELIAPILKPTAHMPMHWDGLYAPFFAGLPAPFRDRRLVDYLNTNGIRLLEAGQYLDQWRLGPDGVAEVGNDAMKRALGF